MKRKWWALLLFPGVVCTVLVLGVNRLLTFHTSVADMARIKAGMTRAEVEAILGKPDREPHPAICVWMTSDGAISIHFYDQKVDQVGSVTRSDSDLRWAWQRLKLRLHVYDANWLP